MTTAQAWYDPANKDRAGATMCSFVRSVEQRQAGRHRRDRLHATLYADQPVKGLGPYAYLQFDDEPECARLNLIKAVTDTWVAAMVKSTPRPRTVTEKGDWALKRKGEGLNLWIDGMYDQHKISAEVCPFVLRGAAIFGTSFLQVYEDVPGGLGKGAAWDEAQVGIDVVFAHQVTVPETEAQDPRNIRNAFVRHWYDVDQLCEMFPASRAQIRDAPRGVGIQGGASFASESSSNLVEVVEGYHRRSSRIANDGVRCIGLPNCTLARVPYTLDRWAPLVSFRRMRAPFGLMGIGIPQELRGSQTTINEIMLAYEEAMIYFARPKWIVDKNSGVERAHLDDRIGSVVEFEGPVAPTMLVPNAVMPGDVMQILQMTWARGFEQTGTNQILASGQVPAGLKSGDAIEEYNDTGAARGLESVKEYEAAHVDLAELMIETGRAIAEHNPKFASTYTGKRRREIVYFKKVDPGRDGFSLKVQPVSELGSTFSGKRQELDSFWEKGMLDERAYRRLIGWPDVDEEAEFENAPWDVAEKILGDMYEAKDPGAVAMDPKNQPDPNWPLEYIRARFMLAAAYAFVNNAPDDLYAAINLYTDRVDAELARIPKPAPPAPPMMMGPQTPAALPPGPAGPPMPPQLPAGGPPAPAMA